MFLTQVMPPMAPHQMNQTWRVATQVALSAIQSRASFPNFEPS